MRSILTLLFFVCFLTAYSQQRKNLVFYLNDGSTITCKDYTRHSNKPYLELEMKDGSTQQLYYQDFYRLEFDQKKCGVCEEYVPRIYEVFNFDGTIVFTDIYTDGYCKLFSSSYGVGGYGGGLSFYVIREGEELPTKIGITGLISKNFKKVALEYFQDCEKMEAKINKRFKKSRKRLTEIVNYYNENCVQEQ